MSHVKQVTHISATSVSNEASSASFTSQNSTAKKRRPYQAPAFIVSQAFERQALSCAGCLNQAGGWPSFCGMRS